MAAAICLSCSRSDLLNMGGMGGSTAEARTENNIKIVFMLVQLQVVPITPAVFDAQPRTPPAFQQTTVLAAPLPCVTDRTALN